MTLLRSLAPNWLIFRATLVAFAASQLISLAMLALTGHTVEESCRWDCNWYRGIVERGYDSITPGGQMSNVAFWPALPIVASTLATLTGVRTPIAVILASKVAFGLALYWFVRFCLAYRPRTNPYVALAVATTNPYAIYAHVGYTEPLFLASTCAALTLAHEGKALHAGFVSAIGTLVRLPAALLAPALAVQLILPDILKSRRPEIRRGVAVCLAPLGTLAFTLYLSDRVGDGIAYLHVQKSWGTSSLGPLETLWTGVTDGVRVIANVPQVLAAERPLSALRDLGAHRAYYAVTAVAGLVGSVAVGRRDLGLLIFSLGATIAPLSVRLASIPRYVWWQAPLLMLIVAAVSARRRYAVVYFTASAVSTPLTYLGWFSEFAFMV